MFTLTEAEAFSEPESIDSSIDDWGSEFMEGERQWVVGQTEVGLRHEGFELAILQRVLADIRFNPEAAEFYGRVDRNEPLTPGEEVPVDISVNGFSARGVRAGFRHDTRTWMLHGGVTLLQSSHLMSGDLNGQFVATSETDYDFNAAVDYHYYEEPIFDRPDVEPADGLGWSFQLEGEWQPRDWIKLRAEADDLFAKIVWWDAPYTRARAHTERKRYDEEGYAVFDPILMGEEGYDNTYYQELDPRFKLDTDLRAGFLTAHLQGRYQFGYRFAGVGAGVQVGALHLKAMTWPKLDAYGLELGYRLLKLGVSLDKTAREEAQYLSFTFSLGY